jgi:hypothetical protein
MPIDGLFHADEGLAAWRQARDLYLLGLRPGLKVVTIGHSIEEGVSDSAPGDSGDHFAYRHANLLRRDLRAALAPAGSGLGGFGFFPAIDSGATGLLAGPGSYLGGERTGQWLERRYNDAAPAEGACRRYMESTTPGSAFRFYHGSSGLSSKVFAARPTEAELVYQSFPGAGALRVTVTSWSGSALWDSGQIDCSGPLRFGVRSVRVPLTSGFWVRVENISASDAPVRIEGFRFYAGDADAGVHVTNLACGGTIADAYLSDANVAAIAAERPDLVIVWLDHLDFFGPKARGVRFWNWALSSTISRIRAACPDASVLFKLGFDFVGGPWATWEYAQGLAEKMAISHGAALFSHHVLAGRAQAWAFASPIGVLLQGKVHFTRDPGQGWEKDRVLAALLSD